MRTLKSRWDADGVYSSVNLYTREDTAKKAFEAAVLEDLGSRFRRELDERDTHAKEIIEHCIANDGEYWWDEEGYKIYYYPWSSYEYCDYNGDWDSHVSVEDLEVNQT